MQTKHLPNINCRQHMVSFLNPPETPRRDHHTHTSMSVKSILRRCHNTSFTTSLRGKKKSIQCTLSILCILTLNTNFPSKGAYYVRYYCHPFLKFIVCSLITAQHWCMIITYAWNTLPVKVMSSINSLTSKMQQPGTKHCCTPWTLSQESLPYKQFSDSNWVREAFSLSADSSPGFVIRAFAHFLL